MKKLKPYIIEMAIFVFCVTIVSVGLIFGGFVSVKMHISTIAAIILISLIMLWCFYIVFRRGILALVDVVFNLTNTDVVNILNVMPVQAGDFTSRVIECSVFQNEQRYIYVLKKNNGEKISVISNEYFDSDKTDKYVVVYSKFSKILIDMHRYE